MAKIGKANPNTDTKSEEVSGQVLPFYLVVDESLSMKPDMETVNKNLELLLDTLHGNPMAASKIRLSVVGFSKKAHVHLELSDMRCVEEMPRFKARGVTNYGAVFRLLREHTETDAADLKKQSYRVHRPTVFFYTDGAPSDDDWRESYERLVDPDYDSRPNLVAFGCGEADPDVISEIATDPRYSVQADDDSRSADAFLEFIKRFTRSVIQSGVSGKPTIDMDKPPPGSHHTDSEAAEEARDAAADAEFDDVDPGIYNVR